MSKNLLANHVPAETECLKLNVFNLLELIYHLDFDKCHFDFDESGFKFFFCCRLMITWTRINDTHSLAGAHNAQSSWCRVT